MDTSNVNENQCVHEFLDAIADCFCPECGAPVVQNPRGRRKVFCCDCCRIAWNHKNPKPQNWKGTRTAICPVCGKSFLASHEQKRKRKYCSHACANRGRAAERRQHEDSG